MMCDFCEFSKENETFFLDFLFLIRTIEFLVFLNFLFFIVFLEAFFILDFV